MIKILQLTISMFLHYLVKLDNCKRCRFQWYIARETSKCILQVALIAHSCILENNATVLRRGSVMSAN